MAARFLNDDSSKSFQYKGRVLYPIGNGKFYERKITKHNPKGQRFYWKYCNCSQCGTQTILPVCQISRANGIVTCGKECSIKTRSGENHWLWKEKTQKVRSNGKTAIRIWMPDHPNARKNRIYEHRYVMEKKIDRLLLDEEVVHHIDCDSHNNDPSNLSLCSSGKEHLLAHGSLNNCVKELLKRKHLLFDDVTKTYFLP
jgi:hypothetical protein